MINKHLQSSLLALLAASVFTPLVAHAEDADAEGRGVVSEVVVTGETSDSIAAAGTKSDTPIAETPQSITVVDAARIADLGLQNLNQALRYVAGVTPETRGTAAEVYDQFKLRGFDAPVYLDGLKLFASATGYAQPQIDVSRLDRIEILKGPASALYGQSSPGGLIDEASKLPLDQPFYGAVSGTYGTYDLYRLDADVGGQGPNGLLWRVYGSANGADQQQDYGKRERQTISGAVTLGAGGPTSLTLLANYSHDPFNGDYGVWPALGTLIDNPAGQISRHVYGGEPDDFFRRNQAAFTYIFKHDFGNGWAFRSAGRYQYVKSALGIVYTTGSPLDASDPAPTVFGRASYATREQLNDWTFDNQLTGKFDTGALHHSLLIGYDDQTAHSSELYAFGSATPIDVFDPVYGTMPTPRTPAQVPDYAGGLSIPADVSTRQAQQGIYAQDQVSLGALRVTLSGREDWAKQSQGGQSQQNSKFTWRAGALYTTAIGVAPYVSYSTSFEPQAALLVDGTLAKPSLGKQLEAGAKYQTPDGRILLTAAWFRINQTNVVVSDPVTFLASQVGKVRSQGVEVEGRAALPRDLNLHVAYSRQRVKDLEDVNPANIGQSLATVGRGGVTADLEWSPAAGPAQGLTLGAAVRHVDKVYADRYFYGVTYYSPAYTVVDALARLDLARLNPRWEGVTASVNATNLFNKTYLTSCFANYGWCWYGAGRTVQGTIAYRW